MLLITIPGTEIYDEERNEFRTENDVIIEMEHSLVSLSKWESKFEKPFLTTKDKTPEETLEYVKCMVLTPDVPDEVFNRLTRDVASKINDYVTSKMSATWFKETNRSQGLRSDTVVTAEIIYHWMIAQNIPVEFETWHLERLLTLIRVVNEKNKPQKKMSRREIMSQHAALNAQRRQMNQS